MTATRAVVCLPALDLRPRPEHRAELGSQLLMGEVVVPGRRRAGWRHVTNLADGYAGWVREWGLVEGSVRRVAGWTRAATARVCAPLAVVRTRPGSDVAVGPVFFGCRLIAGRARGGWVPVELPDARRGWVERSAVALPGDPAPTLEQRILGLLGVPYLWGGRTPAGYDCSAFVQQILREQGFSLPRDAADQHRASRALRPGAPLAPGDLAFFATADGRVAHVGIYLAGALFAHARGRVTLASLDRGNALCDSELIPQFVGWRRPRRAPARG